MKLLRGLLHVFEIIIAPVKALLAKLKLWHQILLVILIMSIFLLVEGLLSLNMLGRMQEITQNVFDTSVQSEQTINSVKGQLDQIEQGYISTLTDGQPFLVDMSSFDSTVQGLHSLKNKLQLAEVDDPFSKIKNLVKQPVSLKNLQSLSKAISSARYSLTLLENDTTSEAINTLTIGKNFTGSSRNITIIILVVSLLLSLVIGLLIASLVVKPLKAMIHAVELLAQGDFTQTLSTKGNREINRLVESLNNAITHLRGLISHITEQSEILSIASKELDQASTDSGRAASEVAHAMEEMAKATAEQTEQINTSSNNVNELGQLVRQVSNDTQSIANASEQVAASAKAGQQVTMDVAENIGALYETTKAIQSVINEMNKSSEEIREFASVIGGIAEQTTLLALNAAIEAARAGEHGKGFSVVAKETGKLADQSKQASERIGYLISEMMIRSSNAVQVIQQGIEKVEAGKNLSTKAASTFENIFKELGDTLDQIHHVAQFANQMAQRNEEVINSVTSVAAISEESMASTEEISATVQGQSAGAEEVAALADNLTNIADSLKQAVTKFKIA